MGVVKEKPIWKFSVTGGQETSTKSHATARGKTYVIDEPIQRHRPWQVRNVATDHLAWPTVSVPGDTMVEPRGSTPL